MAEITLSGVKFSYDEKTITPLTSSEASVLLALKDLTNAINKLRSNMK